ncbi:hypothetical protein BU16DRAFT_621265 [Lophium mytilinum]|uniref:Uncharacterized protein n=1 Tax=Lophium mytilinum TaxID=390894 RepID=A0A6A6QK34_9PEZI|nr:hypothetical protein BU16DRAFT_621265 [Lophium mytilinum]
MYEHIFSCASVVSVWKNLRAGPGQDGLVVTFQYPRGTGVTPATNTSGIIGKLGGVGKSGGAEGTIKASQIGLIVPWRSLREQEKQAKEREREIAECVVRLVGEVGFEELPPSLQNSASSNPYIQIRHIAPGISRQMSRVECAMMDNAPYARGKNLHTGGEIVRKFLPSITALFRQDPAPRRMTFELLVELKDIVLFGTACADRELVEDDLNGYTSFEEVDEALARSLGESAKERWLDDEEEILYHLESFETTAEAMKRPGVDDFCAKAIITLKRMVDRRTLFEFAQEKKKRDGRCGEYSRCMKWAGTAWKQGGGCRRGCKNEDEDPEGLPSWHSSSRHFVKSGMISMSNGGPGTKRLGS